MRSPILVGCFFLLTEKFLEWEGEGDEEEVVTKKSKRWKEGGVKSRSSEKDPSVNRWLDKWRQN